MVGQPRRDAVAVGAERRHWLGRLRRGPLNRLNSNRQVGRFLEAAGSEKIRSMTLGFRPFAFLEFKLKLDSLAIKLH